MPGVLDRLREERDRALDTIDDIANTAEADGRDLSEAELQIIGRHRARIETELDPQLTELEAVEVTRAAHQRAAQGAPDDRTGGRRPAELEPEQPVYRSFAEYARDQILVRHDQIAQRAGAGARQAAEQRIARAVANTISSDVPGLLPPQYLTELVDIISTARPIVESSRRVNLTAGVLRYPDITQRPLVGKQTAEKTEGPSRKMTVAFVDVIADTYTGCGDLSWQVVTWSQPDALALWFDLMAEEYARQTEAAAGTVLGALTAGPTPPSADLAGWLSTIAAAAGTVYATSGRMANTIYADVATGYKLVGLVSAQSPIFLPAGGFSLSSGQGNIAGLQLVISRGLAAQTVVVGDSSALLCAENAGAPVELRAVEPALGGYEVGVIGAFAAKVVDVGAFVRLVPPAGP